MLINRLQQKLGEQVYVIALFDSPTVAGLAHYLGEACPDAVRRRLRPGSLTADRRSSARSSSRAGIAASAGAARAGRSAPAGGVADPLVHGPSAGRDRGLLPGAGAPAGPGAALLRDPFARACTARMDLPGRMEEMAAEYVAAIREIQPHGPYLLGGWSAGGLVALEMAQQLLAAGRVDPPARPARHDAPRPPATHGADTSGQEYGLDLSLEELARLGPDEQLPYLWQHALKLGLIESERPVAGRPAGPRRPQAALPPSHGAGRRIRRPSLPGPDHACSARPTRRSRSRHRATGAGGSWSRPSTSTSFPASTTAWSRNRMFRLWPERSTRAWGRWNGRRE